MRSADELFISGLVQETDYGKHMEEDNNQGGIVAQVGAYRRNAVPLLDSFGWEVHEGEAELLDMTWTDRMVAGCGGEKRHW